MTVKCCTIERTTHGFYRVSATVKSEAGWLGLRGSYAAFRFPRFANGERALPALISAQRFFAAATIALRVAALSLRFGFANGAASAGAAVFRAPGGRPRRFPVGPPRASMARFSLSRSEIKTARICSVDISSIVSQEAHRVIGAPLASAPRSSRH
jgi:hypothetical protein